MYASILNITVDCTDARRQAAFWAAVTGWAALERDATPGHVEYAVMPPVSATPRLYFVTVPEPKRNKNRIHLDIVPPAGGQQAELARLAALGAKVADCQPPGVSWVVLTDPEGNEFCLEEQQADLTRCLRVRVTERCEVQAGAGEEPAEQGGPVLHPLEPRFDQGGQLADVPFGQVRQGSFQVRPHQLDRVQLMRIRRELEDRQPVARR